jgi:hypothetical protein
VSQMPDVAGSWPEEGAQYAPGAPMEPVQQAYPQAPYPHQQQQYQQQGYPQQQYQQQAQQQYPAQPAYPEQQVPQQAMYAEEEQASVPSEFDHLFRDSPPQERRSINARQPMVSGPGAAPSPGFPQQAPAQQQTQAVPQAAAATAVYNPQQQAQQPMQGYEQGYDTPGQQTEYVGQFGGRYDGPDGPGGPRSGGSGPGGRRTPLVIGGVVVLIAAVGLYLGLSGGGGSAGKKPDATKSVSATTTANSNESAQQQADAVYALVKSATTLRQDISGAVDKLLDCKVSDAQSQIATTYQARSAAVTKVATLPVGKISGAQTLIGDLRTAWQDSATSDQEYGKAAADFASGNCSAGGVKADANYQAAVSGSGASARAKETAASEWNQVMANYEPKINEDDL